MGRKAFFDEKPVRGPGRKARKQGEPDVNLLLSKINKKSNGKLNKRVENGHVKNEKHLKRFLYKFNYCLMKFYFIFLLFFK